MRYAHFYANIIRPRSTCWADDEGRARFDEEARITVAYHKDQNNRIAFGCAFCAPQDNFSRRKGRYIAAGRAGLSGAFSFPAGDASEAEILEYIATVIRSSNPSDDSLVPNIQGRPATWHIVNVALNQNKLLQF